MLNSFPSWLTRGGFAVFTHKNMPVMQLRTMLKAGSERPELSFSEWDTVHLHACSDRSIGQRFHEQF